MKSPKAKIQLVDAIPPGTALVTLVTKSEVEGRSLAFKADFLETLLLQRDRHLEVAVGIGDVSERADWKISQACGAGVRALLARGCERLSIDLFDKEEHLEAGLRGALVGAYEFRKFRTDDRSTPLRQLSVVTRGGTEHRESARRAASIAQAVNYAREIGNEPPNVMNPEALMQAAQELAEEAGYDFAIWDRKRLKKEGFGGILAVGDGSNSPPFFVTLQSKKPDPKLPLVGLVGKGVSFDTGGLSLKSYEHMADMKYDKLGACAVLGALKGIAELHLPVRICAAIPFVENMPGPKSFRPDDILRAWDGQTIEVVDTDAEGRLILADALAYTCKTWKPDVLLDFATLTGACEVAVGKRRAGMFTDDEVLADALSEAGEATGDRVWRLPLGSEFDEHIKSHVADVKNLGKREGGASSAAAFLKRWVKDTRWAHFDIAGPAQMLEEVPWISRGATGFGVGLTIEFIRSHIADIGLVLKGE